MDNIVERNAICHFFFFQLDSETQKTSRACPAQGNPRQGRRLSAGGVRHRRRRARQDAMADEFENEEGLDLESIGGVSENLASSGKKRKSARAKKAKAKVPEEVEEEQEG